MVGRDERNQCIKKQHNEEERQEKYISEKRMAKIVQMEING